jgi:hypothetical protein
MSFPVSVPVGIFTQLYKVTTDMDSETPLEAQVRHGLTSEITYQIWRITTDTWRGLRDQGYREWEGQ